MGMKGGRRDKEKGKLRQQVRCGEEGEALPPRSPEEALYSLSSCWVFWFHEQPAICPALSAASLSPASLSPPAFLLRTTALLCFFPLEMGFPIPAASISSLTLPFFNFIYFFPFIFISWRLITLQYWSGFCHTLTWISHGFTCIPHPDPPSHLSLHLIPLGLPSAPGPSTCLMYPAWAGDLFHPR